jgi:hypothetical protein
VRVPADGYILLLANAANAINAMLYEKLDFNFIRDIAPVANIMRGPLVMVVNPSVPANTVPEFIAYAKANPGKITMARPSAFVPPSRPPNSRISSSATSSSSRCGAEQRKALEKTRRGSSARSNSIGDGPQIHSTNHRHNYG